MLIAFGVVFGICVLLVIAHFCTYSWYINKRMQGECKKMIICRPIWSVITGVVVVVVLGIATLAVSLTGAAINEKLIFLNSGIGEAKAMTISEGYSLPAPDSRGNYVFVGWYADADFVTLINSDVEINDMPTYIYAKWELVDADYKLTVGNGIYVMSYSENSEYANNTNIRLKASEDISQYIKTWRINGVWQNVDDPVFEFNIEEDSHVDIELYDSEKEIGRAHV